MSLFFELRHILVNIDNLCYDIKKNLSCVILQCDKRVWKISMGCEGQFPVGPGKVFIERKDMTYGF